METLLAYIRNLFRKQSKVPTKVQDIFDIVVAEIEAGNPDSLGKAIELLTKAMHHDQVAVKTSFVMFEPKLIHTVKEMEASIVNEYKMMALFPLTKAERMHRCIKLSRLEGLCNRLKLNLDLIDSKGLTDKGRSYGFSEELPPETAPIN